MTTFQEFIRTAYTLTVTGQWAALTEYFSLIREILKYPTLKITVGKPEDKPLK